MNTSISDFTTAEQKLISTQLFKRYGKLIPVQPADSELQLGADPAQLTTCPTVYWAERGAHFVICKVAADHYRCQFFYSDADQYGTGREEYDDLECCMVTLSQVQSDHERQLANVSSAATAAKISEDYYFSTSMT